MNVTNKETLQNFLDTINNNPLFNTSYPIKPEHWFPYKQANIDLFENEDELSIYIHIPFCERLCAFCEYTRYQKDSGKETHYMDILEHDIDTFIAKHKGKRLVGLDIGGGTPTALDDDNFTRLMQIVRKIKSSFIVTDKLVCSIEGTFESMSETKIQMLSKECQRVSIGVQSTNLKVLFQNNKVPVDIKKMDTAFSQLRTHGVEILNLDFMYGLDGQGVDDIQDSFKIIDILQPEHFTIYETRYNMTNPTHDVDRNTNKYQYDIIYEIATSLGYNAEYGRNTFSKHSDLGLSSYLYNRTVNNTAYKGFGISAQSKSNIGLSYNIGKCDSKKLDTLLSFDSFEPDIVYLLPKQELLAKYVAICGYLGFINWDICEAIMPNFISNNQKVLQLLLEYGYVEYHNHCMYMTTAGFKYYAGILALFYPAYVTTTIEREK